MGKTIEPFTYYRNATRAFLVADVRELQDETHVVLIEWGRSRHEPKIIELNVFLLLLQEQKLIPFTPRLQDVE